jgi:hypothetical protein
MADNGFDYAEFSTEPPVCPECQQHKCANCTDAVLDSDDLWTNCACKVAGHA